jgi:hypothetical protein
MRLNRFLRPAALGLVALCSLLVLSGSAVAARPTFHDKIDETFPDELCGFPGSFDVTGNQVVTLSGDNFKVTGQVTVVFTADNGKVLALMNAGIIIGTVANTGEGTITFTTTNKGLPEKISANGQGKLLRDAGVISVISTLDLNTGEFTDEVIVKGPHPEADSDFTLFCEVITDALT